MSAFPSLPLFTDAFLADTGHLSAQETGAYLLLLMMAWRSPGCSLPDDDRRLARWARVDARTWSRIKPTVMEFWSLEDGAWTQKRLSKERDIVSKRAEVARDNGKHGGRPKSLKDNDRANPPGLPQDTQRKAPNPIPSLNPDGLSEASSVPSDACPKRKRVRTPTTALFDEFWSKYPTDSLMSKKQAAEAFGRLNAEDQSAAVESIPAFRRYCEAHADYRPVHANRYLSQRRFEGFCTLQAKAVSQVFVAEGTPQWEAWQRVKRTTVTDNRELRKRGWWFPSEWPQSSPLEAVA